MWDNLIYKLNTYCKAHILYLGREELVLYKGEAAEGLPFNSFETLTGMPLILVIDPVQFLKVDQTVEYIGLSDYQTSILSQLNNLSLILLSVVFLPNLIASLRQDLGFLTVKYDNRDYLFYQDKAIIFCTPLQAKDRLQQIRESYLYLRRYSVRQDGWQDGMEILEITLKREALLQKAIKQENIPLESKNSLEVSLLLAKQESGKLYYRTVKGLMTFLGAMILIGVVLCGFSLYLFLNHNPWHLSEGQRSFNEEERQKLYKFKNYLDFKAQSKAFNFEKIAALFQKFPGRMVATDISWELGKWSVFIVLDPNFLSEKKAILQWIDQTMPNSKITEPTAQPHQFSLEFNE